MIYNVITKTGKSIKAQAFLDEPSTSSIYIFTNELTQLEAYQLFENKAESSELKVVMEEMEDDEKEGIFTIYKHYTDVYGIRKSPIGIDTKVIQIWLKKEYPEDW